MLMFCSWLPPVHRKEKQNPNIAAEAERPYSEQDHLARSAKEDVMSYGDADSKAAGRVVRQLPH